MKAFFVIEDLRTELQCHPEIGIGTGEVPIFDMKGFSLKHLTKVTLMTLKVYFKFLQVRIHILRALSIF